MDQGMTMDILPYLERVVKGKKVFSRFFSGPATVKKNTLILVGWATLRLDPDRGGAVFGVPEGATPL
jgi:hypothetical protein